MVSYDWCNGGDESYNTCIIVSVELLVLNRPRGDVVKVWRVGLWANRALRSGPAGGGVVAVAAVGLRVYDILPRIQAPGAYQQAAWQATCL